DRGPPAPVGRVPSRAERRGGPLGVAGRDHRARAQHVPRRKRRHRRRRGPARCADQRRLMDDRIRDVLSEHARLAIDVADLGDDVDLYQAGMTSHASVNVMLALEDAFDIEFPEHMLRKRTFESVTAIRTALTELNNGSG